MSNWKLGTILNGSHEEGTHAWYQNVLPGLGIKIFKNVNINKAIDEYLISKYLESSGFTTNVHAVGWVYLKSPLSNKVLYRPAIWMEHVEGTTARDVLDNIIYRYCPKEILRDTADIKTAWAYASSYFTPMRTQLERAVSFIEQSYGVKMLDHYMNMNNFILQKNGLIKLIDFSKDNRYCNGIKCQTEIEQKVKMIEICSKLPNELEMEVARLLSS